MAAKKPTGGRLSPSEFRDMINKAAGQTYAYDLTQENPTQVPFWISTGSTILDRTTRQKA